VLYFTVFVEFLYYSGIGHLWRATEWDAAAWGVRHHRTAGRPYRQDVPDDALLREFVACAPI